MTTARIQAIQTGGRGTRTVLRTAPLTGRGDYLYAAGWAEEAG